MSAPLPLTYMEMMANNWEIIGQFMYPVDAYRRLLDLVSAHPPAYSKLMLADQALRTEGNKLQHDTMKQLITISSGSILIIVAFLEKVFSAPQWKFLVAVAFVGFLVCIGASLVMMRAISLNVGAGYKKDFQPAERPAFAIAVSSFLVAIGALVAFVIRNLL